MVTTLKWVWRANMRQSWDYAGRYTPVQSRGVTPARNGCRWNLEETLCLLAGRYIEKLSVGQLAARHQRGLNAIDLQLERADYMRTTLIDHLQEQGLLTPFFKEPTMSATGQQTPAAQLLYCNEDNLTAVRQAFARGEAVQFVHISLSAGRDIAWQTYTETTAVGFTNPSYVWRVKPARVKVQACVGLVQPTDATPYAAWMHADFKNVEFVFEDGKLVNTNLV